MRESWDTSGMVSLLFAYLTTGSPQWPTPKAIDLVRENKDTTRLFYGAIYRAKQASSYDRASVRAGNDAWFANNDFGNYIRTEQRDGRTEHVMADLKGPGLINRIWSANPTGTLRIYLDDDTKPAIEADFADLLSGKTELFPSDRSYVAAMGYNLYYPLPYVHSAKVTLESDDHARIYYMVGHRDYAVGGSMPSLKETLALRDESGPPTGINAHEPILPPSPLITKTVAPGETARILDETFSGYLAELGLWIEKATEHDCHLLRMIVTVDGEKTVDVPVREFFTLGNADGSARELTMSTHWKMPVGKTITVDIQNLNDKPFRVSASGVKSGAHQQAPFRFYALYRTFAGSTRPFADLPVANIKGEGRYVGTVLAVENPTATWWGEGDEKIFVDGEASPSFFGTGTEDYFGYAWCSPQLFGNQFHGQTEAQGPANYGHVLNYRWHHTDDIPFQNSLDFYLEKWHWQEVDARYSTIAMWYGKPGKTPIDSHTPQPLAVLEGGKPVEGAIEGEDMADITASSGQVERQTGWIELSNNYQLWWKHMDVGATLTMTFQIEEAGRYEILGNFCQATDYGIHRLKLDHHDLGQHDFYATSLGWTVKSLGIFDMAAGKHTLTVTAVGAHPDAKPGRMFGLDYIKPVRKSDP